MNARDTADAVSVLKRLLYGCRQHFIGPSPHKLRSGFTEVITAALHINTRHMLSKRNCTWCSGIDAYRTRTLWQITRRPFQNIALLADALELVFNLGNFTLQQCCLTAASTPQRPCLPDPHIQVLIRNPEPAGYLHHAVALFDDLFECLSLKFGCVSDSLNNSLSGSILTFSGV